MSNETKSLEQLKQEFIERYLGYIDADVQEEFSNDLDTLLAAHNEQIDVEETKMCMKLSEPSLQDVWGDDKDGQYHEMYVEELRNKFEKQFEPLDTDLDLIWQWIVDNCLSPATKTREENNCYNLYHDVMSPELPNGCPICHKKFKF